MAKPPAPGSKKRGNLQAALRGLIAKQASFDDDDIRQLAAMLVLDSPDDKEHHATRARLKLDGLRLLHDINVASRPPPARDTGPKLDDPSDDNDDNESFQAWHERRKNATH